MRGFPVAARRHPRAARLEPVEVGVETLEQRPLQRLVAVRALAPEGVPAGVAPDHAGGEAHGAAGRGGLLEVEHARAELARVRCGGEAGHPRAGHDQVRGHASEKLALCSTYSSLIRPGVHTNTASVLAASTTSATSAPRARTSRSTASAESHEHREVVEQRALALRRAAALAA